jgi:peptide/nickel transport system ATP-binding protein
MIMLHCSQLKVVYREDDHNLLAVDRVDLRLEAGRVLALVGESGSGKSSLARALAGLSPTNARVSGQLQFRQQDLTRLTEEQWNTLRWSQIALVAQNGAAALNPSHRIGDQVAEPLIVHRDMAKSQAQKQAASALAEMGLDPVLAGRYPHELSGGQIQRALLAMALILDPPVLILDEPTASLDPGTRNFIIELIVRLRARGKAILLITHDLDTCRRLADDVAVLYLGQIMEQLPADHLFTDPCHPYTLALARSYPTLDGGRELGGIRGDAFYRITHAHDEAGFDHTHIVTADNDDAGHAPRQGCLFAPRCTQAQLPCRSGEIAMIRRNTHRVRCRRGGIAPLLELHQVGKRYGKTVALHPENLTLRCGEVFSLVGETGSGKSTLAMIAAGAMPPDGGRRSFENRDMNDWLKKDRLGFARQVGVIDQHPDLAVSHRLCVLDIVAEPLRIQQPSFPLQDIERRVKQSLAEVHLPTRPEFLRHYPHQLNQGALQRLCIARALITGPRLLIADEPTSALDPSVQAKVMKVLLDLQIEKGLTLLLVTHDLGIARKVSDRIGVMHQGRLVEVGPAARILQTPQHPQTRHLLEQAHGGHV